MSIHAETGLARPAALLVFLILASPVVAAERRWALTGELVAFSAPALPGVVVGAAARGGWQVGGHLTVGVFCTAGQVSEASTTWAISQTHILGGLSAGLSAPLGVANLGAELDAGVMALSEVARRHQFQRLSAAGVPDLERTATTLGPFAALRLGVGVAFVEGWQLKLTLGPEASWLRIADKQRLRAGVASSAGVSHAF